MKKVFQLLACTLVFFAVQNTANAQCQVTTVSTPDGKNTAYICPQDGNPDIVNFANSNTSGSSYTYVITDNNYNLLAIEPNDFHDFDGAPAGNCFVWGLSYTGDFIGEPGGSVFSTPFSTGCWNISQNAISVIRDLPAGGTVATPQGETSVYACLDDGIPDFVGFTNTSASNAAYTYVITDEQNNILGLPGTDFLDFSGAGTGVCRVWGLSYTGNLLAAVGDNAAAVALSDNCFSLSENYITVTRNSVDGGTVAMPSGATYRQVCTMDGNPDIVMFVNTSTSSANYAYAITDSNNNILTTTTESQFDFDGAPTGTCRIWGFSYTGAISAVAGESVFSTQLSEGCFEISTTAITVSRTGVDGGTVAMPSGATLRYTCPGDGEDDIVMFTHETSTPNVNYAYVITDPQGNILGLPPANSQNFEGAGVGECWAWGLAYTGSITVMAGDNALSTALSDGCFSLSENFIKIVRDHPDGGTVSTADGETTIELCVGDGNDDFIDFSHMTSSMSAYRYVVTDDQNNILGLPPGNTVNFEGAGTGTCRVWGLSYTGMVTAQMGDNAATMALATSCFELSSNFVTVVRTGVDGGEVTTVDGATSAYTCPGDGVDDIIQFVVTTSEAGANQQLVVTDNNLNVLGLPPGNEVNFEGAGVGECWAWNLSYTGNLNLQMGDNVADVPNLSDGCFSLSDAFVTVNRDEPDGGNVTTASGETAVSLVTGDGMDDIIEFAHTGASNSLFTYVITDDQNNILGIPPGSSQNFEGAEAGVCRVWGLAYTGEIIAGMGDNAASVALTDGCFDLSDNFIEVTRLNPLVGGGGINVSLSPNPTPNVLFVEMDMEEKATDETTVVTVYHLSGQVMHQQEFATHGEQNRFQLNLGDLEEGFYKVAIQNGQAFEQVSFVKQ